MSNLVEHAERELKIAGLFDEDSDYGGMLGTAVLDLVKVFAEQGHSGFSAGMAIGVFTRLAQYDNLTPLTDNPEDWVEVADSLWQNRRKSSAFSTDGGRTYKVNGSDEVIETEKS